MGKPVFLMNSLKTRLVIGSLAIFLASLWSLWFYVSHTLRMDMERLLGEQQFSTVSLVADRVDHEFEDRIEWLAEAARQTERTMPDGPEAVQAQLEAWKNLFSKFNGGTFVTGVDGTAIAAIPLSSGRVGVNYMDREYLITALKQGQMAIGSPVIGRTSKTPVIVVAIPLRGERKEVIGALTGVINMAEPNFLDHATHNQYGKTGGYLMVVPQKRIIATATDKTRVMEVIPEGENLLLDRFLAGHEGHGVTVNTRGLEVLSAAKRIPVAGWYVLGYLPTDEAFAPIREMERRWLLATIVLMLLAAILSWILLRRQLSPLMAAVRSLDRMSDTSQPARPLTVIRDDEIGQLIGGFNRLLEMLGQRESLLKQVLDTTSVAIFLVDRNGRITQANQGMAEMFSTSVDALVESDCVSLMPEDDHAATRQNLLSGLEKGKRSVGVDRLFSRADQTCFWGHLTVRRFVDARGEDHGLLGVIVDVTVRKEAEEGNRLAASVFSHAREGITITAADGTIIDVNDAFTRITGYTREEALGKNPRIIKSNHHDAEFYAAMWRDLLEKGNWTGEIWNRRKSGELYPELLTISAVRDDQGRTMHYVALFTDITPMKAHEEQLRHMAHFDLLTTLPNRALLGDRLHQAMTQTLRRKQLLTVGYLDLDGFKAVNDTYGHKTGDQLLIELANRMRQILREGDTLARLGGDEFVVVLIDLNDASAGLPMLNRLLNAAAQPVRVGEHLLQVSASLGVTFFPQSDEVDADQLLRQADQAMYQAKLAGKNRYHVFDADQDRNVRGHHESLEHIRRALAEGEFVLYYQPKVNMRSGDVVGAEALIRWQHPEKGLLPPAAFLPMIENHALAAEVDEWVVARALTQMEAWRAVGLTMPVSVNISPRHLQQQDFSQRLATILAAHPNARAGDLELEVLETSALEDLIGVSQIMKECRELGVEFALDDFGTGYSSLTYLKRLPVSLLKIDQSFVRDMLDDPDDLAILEGVISLAAAFRRQVIAEGVETVEHGKMLLQLGCELAQGYGIARPMPAADLQGWAASWRPDPAWSELPPVDREDYPLLFATTEHRAWVSAVEGHLRGERIEPPPLNLHQCRFGLWLDVEGQNRYGSHPDFWRIERLHRQVHEVAEVLCDHRGQKRTENADDDVVVLHGVSDQLLSRLQSLLQGNRG